MKNGRVFLFGILLLGTVLRVFTISTETLHKWDEEYHALVAKNCIENPLKPMLYKTPLLEYDYRDWTANHVWLHKQPIPLWTIAGSIALFGVSAISVRIPSLLLSLLMVYLTFLIGRKLFNTTVGLIASLLHSINWITLSLVGGWTATDHYDIFFTVLIELAVWLFLLFSQRQNKTYLILGSIIVGMAIMTKWLTAVFVIGLWWVYQLSGKRFNLKRQSLETLIVIGVLLVVVLPWQVYTQITFPLEYHWENLFNVRHISEAIEGHKHNWSFHFELMGFHYGELVYLPVMYLLYRAITRQAKKEELLLLLWILVPYSFFTIVQTKMPSYTLISSPAIFIAISYLSVNLFKWRNKGTERMIFRAFAVCLIAIPAIHTAQWIQSTQNQKIELSNQKMQMNWGYSESTVIFNFPEPIKAMFYQNATVFPTIPADWKIDEILSNGHQVVINEGKNIHDGLRKRKDIEIIDLRHPTHRTPPRQYRTQ